MPQRTVRLGAALYRLDLEIGQIAQLTDGRTRDSGWAIWCEYHLRGIYNHISALNGVRREVYYFQDDEIRCTHIHTFENRVLHRIPGRISVGQTGFSPAGRFLFYENQGKTHDLLSVHYPHHPDRFRLNLLRRLGPIAHGQRYHAHPFLSPDRKRLFYTEVVNGFSQVCALDVEDLVDLNEYWDCR